jgi:predicted ABC-type ATPase
LGEEVAFLQRAGAKGCTVVLCFIGIDEPDVAEERVAMRVLQGGHDVPSRKLKERFPRTLENLARAVCELPYVLVFGNGDLGRPFRKVAQFERGAMVEKHAPVPRWVPRGR